MICKDCEMDDLKFELTKEQREFLESTRNSKITIAVEQHCRKIKLSNEYCLTGMEYDEEKEDEFWIIN